MLDYTQIATYGFPVLAGLAGGILYFKADTRIEDLKVKAQAVSAKMKAFGLKKIPAILDRWVVGDKSGVVAGIIDLVKDLSTDDDAVMRELEDVFGNVLAEKVKTAEGRAAVQSILDAAGVTQAAVAAVASK